MLQYFRVKSMIPANKIFMVDRLENLMKKITQMMTTEALHPSTI